jgi:hypothetical protein
LATLAYLNPSGVQRPSRRFTSAASSPHGSTPVSMNSA